MLYKKNNKPVLEKELFQNPTSEYRCTPFWAWNCKLDQDELLWQIEMLKEMGMGGFHMHSRTGMATKYLSDDFMDMVKACQQKAVQEDMLCWLYDEDRWPSGFAGGYVTKNLRYRARYALFTTEDKPQMEIDINSFHHKITAYEKGEADKPLGYYICSYAIKLEKGYLAEYKKIERSSDIADWQKWHLFVELEPESPWYNNETYVDTLNKEAIDQFISITHDAYDRELGQHFGESVPAIFTDEPQFSRKKSLRFAEDKKEIQLPYTDDFSETYQAAYGQDILDFFPELIWDLPDDQVSVSRYRYHDHICERFTQAFADNVGKWCQEHNLMLTGHMMEEPTLESQTAALGEAMRSYRSFQLPGIDMLCDRKEFTTAKQAQSAARQYGYPGVLSELYGVTNWDFDFKGHKLQGDWQAALGVTVRVPHLSWVSMAGEAKRDYPASISYQSSWYKKYPVIEDHFARLNTALTRGTAVVDIGVIHPAESYWLYWGPVEQTYQKREDLENKFQSFIEWMLYGLIDFDYISESLLPDQCKKPGFPLGVGLSRYKTIIVPDCVTLRSSTLERLEKFKEDGGELIFMGSPAPYVDALPSERAKKLAESCRSIAFTKAALMDGLRHRRVLDIKNESGAGIDNLLYQMRSDGKDRWLFICHVHPKFNRLDWPEKLSVSIKGKWSIQEYHTLDGSITEIAGTVEDNTSEGYTHLSMTLYAHDSVLLKLSPYVNEEYLTKQEICCTNWIGREIIAPNDVTWSEPNVMLLDMAEFAIDDEPWQEEEEILRIDTHVRKRNGWAPRIRHVAQPWIFTGEDRDIHCLRLRYTIQSDIELSGCMLALEQPESFQILWNGSAVNPEVNGYFVDKAIKTFPLPVIRKGINELLLTRDIKKTTDIEWCYILGAFGVEVDGRYKKIKAPNEKIYFGDTVNQGMSFYTGDIIYHCSFENQTEEKMVLEVPRFKGALLTIKLDGEEVGDIVFAPHRLDLGKVSAGKHMLEIKLYGSRINSFGQLHLANNEVDWYGPNGWRSEGTDWSYEYRLWPYGVLQSPILYVIP